jgi:hypothetical protein
MAERIRPPRLHTASEMPASFGDDFPRRSLREDLACRLAPPAIEGSRGRGTGLGRSEVDLALTAPSAHDRPKIKLDFEH